MTPTGIARPLRHSQPVCLRYLVIGALACGLGVMSGPAASAATGPRALAAGVWTPEQAPVLAPAAESPSPGVRQVTCAAVGSCVGVASFTDASRNRAGLIERLRHGAWKATRAPVPAGTVANAPVVLSSVSCPTRRFCAVSGYVGTGGSRQPELLALHRGRWTARNAPLVPGTAADSSTGLSSISCPQRGHCVAVGRYQDGHDYFQGLIEVQSGRTWRAERAPLPAAAAADPVGGLEWVTCPGTGTCTAVGAYVDKHGNRQLSLEVLRHGTWRSSTGSLPAGAASDPVAYLGYVTCRDTGDCLAVGKYVNSLGATEGLFERQVSGRWRATAAPLPGDADPEDPDAAINEASCPTTRFCAAVGAYRDSDGTARASLQTLSHGRWTAVAAPPPPGDVSGRYVPSVSCPAAGWCMAAGSTNASGLFEKYAGGAWTVTLAPLPPLGAHANFQGTSVSCPSVRMCAAFGGFTKHNGSRPQGQGLLETYRAR